MSKDHHPKEMTCKASEELFLVSKTYRSYTQKHFNNFLNEQKYCVGEKAKRVISLISPRLKSLETVDVKSVGSLEPVTLRQSSRLAWAMYMFWFYFILIQFYFSLFLVKAMYDNKLKTKENKIQTKKNIEPQHILINYLRWWSHIAFIIEMSILSVRKLIAICP